MTAATSSNPHVDDQLVHSALLYRDAAELRHAVARFVDEAAGAAAPLLAVLPPESLEVVGDLLTGSAVEHEDMREAGRNPARLIPRLQDWLSEHEAGVRVRVIAEPVWPERGDAAAAECLRHEALLNIALAGSPADVLCTYDSAHLPGEVFAGAERTHPRVIDAAGERHSDVYGDPWVLAEGREWPQAPAPADAIELPGGGDLAALRRAVDSDPWLAVLAPERRQDLVFAVNEVATNAVRHGDGDWRARLWSVEGEIVAEVIAATPIGDPLAGRRRPAPDALDGRGLWLVNQLCDLVELRTDGEHTSVRLHVCG